MKGRMKGRMKAAALILSASLLAAPAVCVSGSESFAEDVSTARSESSVSEAAGAEEVNTFGTMSTAEEAAVSAETPVKRLRFAKDYREVYEALKEAYGRQWVYIEDSEVAMAEDAAGSSFQAPHPKSVRAEESAAASDYTGTNVRTEGVDEADVVKTDGRYIYILRNRRDVSIVEADGAGLKHLSTIDAAVPEADMWYEPGVREFFVNGHLLHILSETVNASYEDGDGWKPSVRETKLSTWDLSDPAHPVQAGEVVQSGSYLQARLTGGKLYVFSAWYPEVEDTFAGSRVIPKAGGRELPAGSVCIPDVMTRQEMLVVTAVDPAKPSEAADAKALISGAEQLYVGGEGIYALNGDYTGEREMTEIVRFSYGGGRIEPAAAVRVRGTVNDSFSIDEYGGCLRVLTTYRGSDVPALIARLGELFGRDFGSDWTLKNALWIFDGGMNCVGSIRGLAEGEEIKSARFLGDTAYFVTFRTTDPLFSADLSDPKHPRILGQLKIPGFSAYLHPMGGGLMAGVGYDADPQTGITTGIKLSLFDMSDPADVRETGRMLLENVTYLPALEDYRAIFADANRSLIGFFLENRYMLWHLTEDGRFERVLLYDFFEDGLQNSAGAEGMRGLRIGSHFYLAGGSYVVAFDMDKDFAKENVLRLS